MHAGLAIGLTVLSGAAGGAGAISGGAFNPAVGLLALLSGVRLAVAWIYLAAPLLGGSPAPVHTRPRPFQGSAVGLAREEAASRAAHANPASTERSASWQPVAARMAQLRDRWQL